MCGLNGRLLSTVMSTAEAVSVGYAAGIHAYYYGGGTVEAEHVVARVEQGLGSKQPVFGGDEIVAPAQRPPGQCIKARGVFKQTQARLAECRTELEAARGLVRRACETRAKIDVAMAKLFATEAAQRIVDAAVQLHGGLGVVLGVKVEELYREVRALRIYEGTSEIQKLIIAREMLR